MIYKCRRVYRMTVEKEVFLDRGEVTAIEPGAGTYSPALQ